MVGVEYEMKLYKKGSTATVDGFGVATRELELLHTVFGTISNASAFQKQFNHYDIKVSCGLPDGQDPKEIVLIQVQTGYGWKSYKVIEFDFMHSIIGISITFKCSEVKDAQP